MIKAICPGAGCRVIVPKGTRCERHAKQQHKGTTKNRSGDPFYNSKRWRGKRAEAMHRDSWLCQDCLDKGRVVAAAVVDHILPRATHPELELELSNLRSLCTRCHNRKTGRETVEKLNGVSK